MDFDKSFYMNEDFRDQPGESQQEYFGIDSDKSLRTCIMYHDLKPIRFSSIMVDNNGKPVEDAADYINKCLGIK